MSTYYWTHKSNSCVAYCYFDDNSMMITFAAFWEIHTLRHQSAWQVIYRYGLCRLVHIKAAADTAYTTAPSGQSVTTNRWGRQSHAFIFSSRVNQFQLWNSSGDWPPPLQVVSFQRRCVQHMGFRGERIKSIKMLCLLFLLVFMCAASLLCFSQPVVELATPSTVTAFTDPYCK